MPEPRKRVARDRWLAIGAALLIPLGCGLPFSPFPPKLPELEPVHRIERPYQGWTDEQRAWFHHVSQGTATPNISYEWFLALEQPAISLREQPLLSDPAYLARFGFIPSEKSELNPGGLPIGFARQPGVTDYETGEVFDGMGFTCAACHTGQIEYRGTRILIEGGPAVTDLGKFRHAVALALGYTKVLPFRFGRFADRLLGPDHTPEQRDALEKKLDAAIERGRANPELLPRVIDHSTEEGFTRLDALGRIGNFVFGVEIDAANTQPLRAPVNYPHIWTTPWFDWVQYNGSIRQPMVRNAGEALGVFARADLRNAEIDRFRSSVQVRNLYDIEQLIAGPAPFQGLRAPRWPEHVLGEIDAEKAARGAALYAELCQGCHLPPVGSAELEEARYWEAPNGAGERYLKLRMIRIAHVGTDPNQARTLALREVDATRAGIDERTFGGALAQVVERVVNRWHDEQTPPTLPAERARMNGNRANLARAPMEYKARPLNGIWATPPYLHNGSVPNLYFLLSPADERPRSFYLGHREYDPLHVGYVYTRLPGGFELEIEADCARLAESPESDGNCNAGHEFRDGPRGAGVIGRALSEDERWELVEYLKTL
jgi:mono/diheme cytochrome c family protein